jgi:hypothetical protein
MRACALNYNTNHAYADPPRRHLAVGVRTNFARTSRYIQKHTKGHAQETTPPSKCPSTSCTLQNIVNCTKAPNH